MKRLLLTLALCLATLTPVQSAGVLFLAQSSGGGGPCSQATTFLARTTGLSGTESTAYTTMICGMVTDGTWGLLDIFYILATNNTTTASLNLINTSFTLVSHGTPSFTADVGYQGNGTNFYLDTVWIPSTNGVNFTQNSASGGAYVLTANTTATNTFEFGAATTNAFQFGSQANVNQQSLTANSNTASFPSAGANSSGMWILNVTASNAGQLYRNASSLATFTTTTTGVPTNSINLFARQTGGGLSPHQSAAFFFGAGLTPTQEAAVSSRINAYMTTFGINVY